jgi:hypothetical protein
MGVRVELSDGTFKRLQALAIPLVDSVEDVIVKLLDQSVSRALTASGVQAARVPSEPAKSPVEARLSASSTQQSAIDGFQRELWDEVILKLPKQFTLSQVYRYQEPLVRLHPDNRAMDATIRAGLQRLRDAGYLEFVSRGNYKRLV